MGSFNPKKDNWLLYEEQLEDRRINNTGPSTNTIEKDKRVVALLCFIGTKTYKTSRDLCTLAKPTDKSYNELCDLLKTRFSTTRKLYRERIDFYQVKQAENENRNELYRRNHNLSLNYEFENSLQSILTNLSVE